MTSKRISKKKRTPIKTRNEKQNARNVHSQSAARTYRGKPVINDYLVYVSTRGREQRFRRDATFRWGDSAVASAMLARALIFDASRDADLTVRVYRRFLHRTVAQWDAHKPWIITSTAIMEHVADILRVEQESAPLRRMVTTAPAPIASEGGRDVEWNPGTPERFGR